MNKGTLPVPGYYLRKHLREDVVLNASGSHNGQPHYSPRIRYTEIFLNYAEAANEAYGPQGKGSFTFSAYDVIKKIRQRARSRGKTMEMPIWKASRETRTRCAS